MTHTKPGSRAPHPQAFALKPLSKVCGADEVGDAFETLGMEVIASLPF